MATFHPTDDCLQELRWLYDRRDLIEARRDLAAWLTKWSGKYSKLNRGKPFVAQQPEAQLVYLAGSCSGRRSAQ